MSDHTSELGHVRPWRHIERRKSRQIRVGSVLVGGDAPISVQSMTNTPTSDAAATIDQIRQLEEAGADIVGGAAEARHDQEVLVPPDQLRHRLAALEHDDLVHRGLVINDNLVRPRWRHPGAG